MYVLAVPSPTVRVALLGSTGSQLATRTDRETARINTALAAEPDRAKDDAASARTLAIIGLVVGALGLVAGGAALAMRRRSPAQTAGASAPADTSARQDATP